MKHSLGTHHLHIRKRIHKKFEKFPHPNKFKSFIDKGVYFVAVFAILMTLPQIFKIWVEKNTAGVSIITWISYFLIATFWLMYGIIHKDKPIIFTNVSWMILDVIIVLGLALF
jgi:uncharacterized protein with PQ loop repeat